MRHRYTLIDRRRALTLGGIVSAGVIVAQDGPAFADAAAGNRASHARNSPSSARKGELPVDDIEAVLQASGDVSSTGVLSVTLHRTDLHVTRNGVPWLPSFQVNGEAYFQSLGKDRAILNGDVALLAKETNPFIAALLRNGLVFQAFHQHFTELSPQIYHVHYRSVGEPVQLARALATAVQQTTSTPFPQAKKSSKVTSLPTDRLGEIIGAKGSVNADGVVSFDIPRSDHITLGGIPIAGDEGIGFTVSFQPHGDGGAVAAPDFSMLASEIDPVMRVMLAHGWEIGCLYNQETDEDPQLYFSHQSKIGDPIELAKEIRAGADKTRLTYAS